MRCWQGAAAAGLLALGALQAPTGTLAATSVYSCVDVHGKRLTSDRYIPECSDREQRLLSPGGKVTVLPPTLTSREREAKAEQDRRIAEEQQRQAEEKRVQRALLARYPNQGVHDAERAKALRSVQDVQAAIQRSIDETNRQKAALKKELDFYGAETAKIPPKLKRQVDELDQQMGAHVRFMATQEEERRRVTAKFDEELARLKVLWGQAGALAAASAPAKR